MEKKGFTAFVYETPLVQAFTVDEYVQGADMTLEQACREGITELFGGWKEMRDIVEWMRNYNLQHPERRKLHYYGADICCEGPYRTMNYALGYLKRVDPEYAKLLEEEVQASKDYTIFNYAELNQQERDAFAAWAMRLQCRLEAFAPMYAAKTGEVAWKRARQAANNAMKAVAWFDTFLMTGSSWQTDSVRDGCMGENMKWVMDLEGEQGKIVYHAHNEHVRRQLREEDQQQTGVHLDFLFGKDAVVSVGCMSYLNMRPDDTCPGDCLQHYLALVDRDHYILNLKELPKGSEAEKWADLEMPDRLSTNFINARLLPSYDIVAFTRLPLHEDQMEFCPYHEEIIELNSEIYKDYVGTYALDHTWFPGEVKDYLTVECHEGRLYSHSLYGADGKPDPASTIAEHSPVALSEMFPISETRFIWKNYCGIFEFKRDSSGKVIGGEYSYYYLEEQKYPTNKIR